MTNQPESTLWNAQLYDDKHSFVWEYGASLVQWLAPKSGDRILDLGCGTGQLTATIAESGAAVIGIDNSAAMLDEARQHHPQIEFVRADAHDFQFDEPFDAIFSNAVLHWISDPRLVIACIARALKLGGRLVVELGGAGNVNYLVGAMRHAANDLTGKTIEHDWYFPTIGQFCGVLESNQLEPTKAVLFDRPTKLDGDDGLNNWIRMFGGRWLDAVPPDQHEDYFRRAEKLARPHLMIGGEWFADYRRLRVFASKA